MRSKNQTHIIGGIVGMVLFFIIAWAIMIGIGKPGVKEIIQKSDQIAEGTAAPSYKSTPPTSGAYYPSTASCKIYDTELPMPQLIHNLRNGNIVFLYKRDIDSTTWGKIRELQNTLVKEGWFLAAPYENMTKKLSVVAWGWHLDLDEYDEKKIMNFYLAHKGNGPENISCK